MEVKITITGAATESSPQVSVSGAPMSTGGQSADPPARATGGTTSMAGISAGAAPAGLAAAGSHGPLAFVGHDEAAAAGGQGTDQSGGAAPSL